MADDSEILVGRWDCPYGHNGQDGEAMKCTACGAPRPEDVEFYLPTDARVVTDTAGIADANAGADLICESCGSSVDTGQMTCPQCSAPLDTTKRQKVTEYASRNSVPTESTRTTRARQDSQESAPTPNQRQYIAEPVTSSGGHGRRMIAGLVSVAIAAALGLWWLMSPHQVTLTVNHTTWERVISLQEQRTVEEGDWSIPSGGRKTGSYQAFHHNDHRKIGERQISCHSSDRVKTGTRSHPCHSGHRVQTGTHRVACGTTNLGNGRFRQDYCNEATYSNQSCTHTCYDDVYDNVACTHRCIEDIMKDFPINATKYSYNIERWFDIQSARSSGSDGATQPAWPSSIIDAKHREAGRTETLKATFTDNKGHTYTNTMNSSTWSSLKVGTRCTAMANRLGLTTEPVCH